MRKILVLLGVVLMGFGIFACAGGSGKKITGIKSFELSVNENNMIHGYVHYVLRKTDDGYIANIKPVNIDPDECHDFPVEESKVEELIGILNTYEVSKWDGFDKVDKRILDGRSFTLSVWINDEDNISAHGYMKYPNNYKEVRKALDEFFGGLNK
jgi:hypothetical protein